MNANEFWVHYFAKDETTGVKSFTLKVSRATGIVRESGYNDSQRFIGFHINEVIRICKEEGYEHHRL